MSKLNNKIAVITGGTTGIGFSTAQEFIEQGAKVVITGRSQEGVDKAVAALGAHAKGLVADQGSLSDAETLAAFVAKEHGKVDNLFINAGVGSFVPFSEADEAHFDSIMDVNFKGAYFTTQKLLPLVNDGGTIIFLSSINAISSMPGASVYSASKAALNSLSRTLSRELAGRGIRVNAINPGPIVTPILHKAGLTPDEVGTFQRTFREQIPLGRMGESEEVAKLVSFLASDDARFITGGDYNIDGGIITHPILHQS